MWFVGRFKVVGSILNKRLLFRIGVSLVGALVTVVPIVIGLRPDINEE
eukprot:SAG31_NODE_19061_length_613_cov_0.807393_2_plen_47_part_01